MLKKLLFVVAFCTLTACSGFFDKDNTPTPNPLVPYHAEATPRLIWSSKTGYGTNGEYLKLTPSISGCAIYTSSASGVVSANNKLNGALVWQVNTGIRITTGPGVGDGIVVVGGRKGEVIAINESNGSIRFRTCVLGEILAKPAIANGIVIIKATDGYVFALSALDGHELWTYQETEPNLILRGSSSPLIYDRGLFVGFANGNLTKMNAVTGQVQWRQPIATPCGSFAIQRMIDIDADPINQGHRVYAATYQGNIASLEWSNGHVLWSRELSTYTGMVADDSTVYVSDACGNVWALGNTNGLVYWRQPSLLARSITAPALMGCNVVVGDAEGYLHWMCKRDGHFTARVKAGCAIYAAPLVDNNVLYVVTSNGNLLAYILQ